MFQLTSTPWPFGLPCTRMTCFQAALHKPSGSRLHSLNATRLSTRLRNYTPPFCAQLNTVSVVNLLCFYFFCSTFRHPIVEIYGVLWETNSLCYFLLRIIHPWNKRLPLKYLRFCFNKHKMQLIAQMQWQCKQSLSSVTTTKKKHRSHFRFRIGNGRWRTVYSAISSWEAY